MGMDGKRKQYHRKICLPIVLITQSVTISGGREEEGRASQ